MIIKEKFTVAASPQQVVDWLIVPENMASCIPGCEEMTAIDDLHFTTKVKVKVGFIGIRLIFKSTITEIDAPNYVKVESEGQDEGKRGSFRQKMEVNLVELSPNETEIDYMSEVQVVGRLATFGEMVMKSTAKKYGKLFASAVQENIVA